MREALSSRRGTSALSPLPVSKRASCRRTSAFPGAMCCAVFDVIVDLRRSSPRFGRSLSVTLDARESRALWVPPGFAHGFLALSDDTQVQYKVTDFWSPPAERTLAWDDPALGIEWPLPANTAPVLSDKDRR